MKSIDFLINSLGNGGAERVVLALAKNFLAQGKQVRIIALSRSCVYEIPQGIEMIYLDDITDEERSSLKRMALILRDAWRLKKIIKTYQIEQIQSHLFRSNYVNILSRLLGARHRVQVVNHSVASRFLDAGISGKIYLFLMRHLYPKADRVVTISKRMLIDLASLVPLKGVATSVIYNPYDVKMLLDAKSQPLEPPFDFKMGHRYLLAIGRLIPLKRYEDILYALAKLPHEVELLILGEDGGSLATLRSIQMQLGLEDRVHFLGQIANPFPFMKRADLLVLSSQTEGFPNVLIEAMLCGTAVIASDCLSGPREILAPDSDLLDQLQEGLEWATYGVLYPVGDRERLSEGISTLLEDRSRRTLYEQKGIKRAMSFAVERIALEYQAILEEKER